MEAPFLEILHDSLTGKVLIAHPNLPNNTPFARSVIYIYQDDSAKGTTGVMTNKRSRFGVHDIASDKGYDFGDKAKFVYHGGPVNPQALVLLHTNDWSSSNTVSAGRKLSLSSDDFMIQKLNQQVPTYWRLFAGMSTWEPGQLTAELEGRYPFRPENSWLIANAPEGLLFTLDGDKQWQKALELCSNQMFASYL